MSKLNENSITRNDATAALNFPSSDTVTLETASTERLRVDSSGNVGIGTDSPGEKLSVVGKIEARSGNWFLARSDDNSNYAYIKNPETSGSALGFYTSGERMKIDSSGDVTITDGDLVIGTAGHGIDFSAQTSTSATGATTTSELLDSYEEGTWTPTLMGHISGTGTLTHYGAYYTKVGNIVHFECYIVCTGLGTISGDIRVGGLPFTVNAAYHSVNFASAEGLSITAGESLTGFCAVNTDYLKVQIWNVTTGTGFLTSTEFTAAGGFVVSGSYFDYS